MAAHGSLEYELTWKSWPMVSGPPISALRASGRRTSDNGYTGWPTTTTADSRGSRTAGYNGNKFMTLTDAWNLAGWPTPMAGSPGTENYNPAGNTDSSRKTVALVGWATPAAREAGGTPEQFLERKRKAVAKGQKMGVVLTSLSLQAQLTGWATPAAQDGERGPDRKRRDTGAPNSQLSTQATLAGWATPTSRDHKDGSTDLQKAGVPINGLLGRQVSLASGPTSTSFTAQTGKRAALNPLFSLWLMLGSGDLARAWASCAGPVTRSSRRSRRKSSAPGSTVQSVFA